MTDRANRILALSALTLTACSGQAMTAPSSPGIQVVSMPAADTIDAVLATPLQIRVTDRSGAPAPNAAVTFTAISVDPEYFFGGNVSEAPLGTSHTDFQAFTSVLAVQTDAAGIAAVVVRLSKAAPRAPIVITALETDGGSAIDTITLVVLPGNPVGGHGVAPNDTSIYTNGSVQLRAGAEDRYHNVIGGAATFVAGPGVAVTSGGLVTATTYGRSLVVAHSAAGVDTAHISVVPMGTILAPNRVGSSSALTLVNLDGSHYSEIPSLSVPHSAEPQFSPDGASFTFSTYDETSDISHDRIFVSDLQGHARTLTPDSMFRKEAHSRYSADGSWIYFAGQDRVTIAFQLWRVHPDGTGLMKLPVSTTGRGFHPDPSPDGTKVAFDDEGSGIHVMDLVAGTESEWFVPGLVGRWSPDGQTLAVCALNLQGLLLLDPATGARRQPTAGFGTFVEVEWSPDGAWLLARGDLGLVLINVGSGLHIPMPRWAQFLISPSWKR